MIVSLSGNGSNGERYVKALSTLRKQGIVYLQVRTSGGSIRITNDPETISADFGSTQQGLKISDTDGIVPLKWIGTMYATANADNVQVEVVALEGLQ
jgi:hypothetical protein